MSLLWFTFGILTFLAVSLLVSLAAGDLRTRRFYQRREWFVNRADEAAKLVAQLREDFHLDPPEVVDEEEKRVSLVEEVDEETQKQLDLLELINEAARENPTDFATALHQTITVDLNSRSRLSVFEIDEADGKGAPAPEPVAAAS